MCASYRSEVKKRTMKNIILSAIIIALATTVSFAAQATVDKNLAAINPDQVVDVIVQFDKTADFKASVARLDKIAQRWDGKKNREVRLMKIVSYKVKGAAIQEFSADTAVARVNLDRSLRAAVTGE